MIICRTSVPRRTVQRPCFAQRVHCWATAPTSMGKAITGGLLSIALCVLWIGDRGLCRASPLSMFQTKPVSRRTLFRSKTENTGAALIRKALSQGSGLSFRLPVRGGWCRVHSVQSRAPTVNHQNGPIALSTCSPDIRPRS